MESLQIFAKVWGKNTKLLVVHDLDGRSRNHSGGPSTSVTDEDIKNVHRLVFWITFYYHKPFPTFAMILLRKLGGRDIRNERERQNDSIAKIVTDMCSHITSCSKQTSPEIVVTFAIIIKNGPTNIIKTIAMLLFRRIT